MKKMHIFAGFGLMLASSPVLAAMTDAECNAAWTKADTNKDGTVTEAEAGRYFASLRVANTPLADGRMTQAIFLDHCKAGLFTAARVDAGAPLSGANSFTEGQAKDRAMAAGVSGVSAMTKDANGVWRGTGSDGSKTVNIAVDYKGNVVLN